jgi:hypothetical protein
MLRFFLFSFFCVNLFAGTQKEGLTYLNTLRTHAGLVKLIPNTHLNKAAKSHAKYLIQNQSHGHYEKKGRYTYTGKTPSKRVTKAGYTSTVVMENLSINTPSQKESIDNLFSAIYHRFVFLNLFMDEIGLGTYKTKKKRRVKQAYVYNLGSSRLSRLCKKSYTMVSGNYYMKDVCKKRSRMIPQSQFNSKKRAIRKKNNAIILYPYVGQQDVYPAFYNESPDPLPRYKVSGFPISVQFNKAFYKKVKLKSFRLYDEKGKEIVKTKILQKNNDPHHLFSKYEFALMPLARLEFSQTYTAIFEAIADGKKIKKKWAFKTRVPKYPLYRISQNKETLHVKSGETIILYMVPSHRKDVLKNYTVRGGMKAVFIDQNTLKITLPKRKSSGRVSIQFANKKKVSFTVE